MANSTLTPGTKTMPASKAKDYRLADPEDDLFSDAMDRAVSMYHSVRHGAMRNAERTLTGNTMDGEKLARRALAAGFKAYLEEIGPTPDETCDQLVRDWHEAIKSMETSDMDAKLTAQRRVVDFERKLMSWAERSSEKASERRCIHGKTSNEACNSCWDMGGRIYEPAQSEL